MTDYDMYKERLMELVAEAQNQRVRPGMLSQKLAREAGFSTYAANEIIKDMVDDGDLVYTYRDPCSYVEIPCNGCEGGHRPARPMKVVKDAMGNPWLCDSDAEEADGYAGVCWDCGSLAFTRS